MNINPVLVHGPDSVNTDTKRMAQTELHKTIPANQQRGGGGAEMELLLLLLLVLLP